jgi:hypothetical protein
MVRSFREDSIVKYTIGYHELCYKFQGVSLSEDIIIRGEYYDAVGRNEYKLGVSRK